MTATTTFFVDLFLLFVTAALAGELASRLGQPALVGQLLVGIVLGPTLLGGYVGLASLGPQLTAIQSLGTVFILFMAGLHVTPGRIAAMGWATVAMGIAVFVVPFSILTVLCLVLYPGSGLQPLFLGLTLSITALPVMAIMLAEYGLLQHRLGELLLNVALVNELVAVTVFAVLLQLRSGSDSGIAIATAGLSVVVFLGVMFAIYAALRAFGTSRRWAATRQRIGRSLRSREAGFALAMIGLLGASLFSQYLGLTFVVGAFYAGILVTPETAGVDAHRAIRSIFDTVSWGFFVPLFFAFAGVEMNLREIATPATLVVFGVLAVAAILSKVGTGYSVARFTGWSRRDSLAIGNLVSSRGAVELAMAVILLGDGVFSTRLYTLVAGVGLVTTFVAPLAAGAIWRRATPKDSAVSATIQAALARPGGGPSELPLPLTPDPPAGDAPPPE